MHIMLIVPLGLDKLVFDGVDLGLIKICVGFGFLSECLNLIFKLLIVGLHFEHLPSVLVDPLFFCFQLFFHLIDEIFVFFSNCFGHELYFGFQRNNLDSILFSNF